MIEKSKMMNAFCSKSSRTDIIAEFIKNPDVEIVTAYLDRSFTNNPSLLHVNFIILTLLQISENVTYSWKKFARVLTPCFEYIQKWKINDRTSKLYRKVILEMLPIIDHAYKIKGGSDTPIIFTLIREAQNYLPALKYLPVDPHLQKKSLQESLESILNRVKIELKKIENKADSLHFKYLNELSILLNNLDQRTKVLKSLKRCRFDKRKFDLFLSHSIILGADNGIYALLNTFSEPEQILFFLDSLINPDMIDLIMKGQGKVVIGEGSFGKIRMAIAILPNNKTDTSLMGGNIICVKKAGSKDLKSPKGILDIWDSTWNNYCSMAFLEEVPEIFDMKITRDCHKKPQGYCFQKLLMLPNGDIFKCREEYQKWFHVKKYFVGIFQVVIKLHKRGLYMTELKPANILYDKTTQSVKFLDLVGALRNENLFSGKIKHVKEITHQYFEQKLLEKIENQDDEYNIDLKKCINWTVGNMMEEICSKIKEFEEPIVNKKILRIKEEVKSLINDLKLTTSQSFTLEKGLKNLMDISDIDNKILKTFESYMDLLKNSFKREDPKIQKKLNLKNEIYTLTKCFNEKLMMTKRSPDKYKYNPSTDKSICDLLPSLKKMLQKQIYKDKKFQKRAVILLGSAGSGKSSILQKIFIEAVKVWRSGDPIPIFMNLAIHNDLKDYWIHLQDSLDLENLLFEDLIKQPLLLFFDSLDESKMDLSVIAKIFHSLSFYANVNSVKMLVACRTCYLKEESERNQLGDNIKLKLRYIIPLEYFFFDTKSNLEELIILYLHEWENRNATEIKEVIPIYLQKIQKFRLQAMMKTTCMIFMILNIMPKLIKLDPTSVKQDLNYVTVYELYVEKNLEHEISRSADEVIKKKGVDWFVKIAILLAESMMLRSQSNKKKVCLKIFAASFISRNRSKL